MTHSRPLLLLCCIALPLITGCASTASTGTYKEAKVVKEYDSVEGITHWTHTPILVSKYDPFAWKKVVPTINMQVFGHCDGEPKTPCEDPDWTLILKVRAKHVGEDPPLTLRLGDRRIRPEPKAYETGRNSNTMEYEERLAFPLDAQDVRDLAKLPKGKVEGRLADTNMNLSYKRRKAIRLLYDKFTSKE